MSFASFLGGPGHDSYNVPLELFQENRQKLADRLLQLSKHKHPTSHANEIIMILQCGSVQFDNDVLVNASSFQSIVLFASRISYITISMTTDFFA